MRGLWEVLKDCIGSRDGEGEGERWGNLIVSGLWRVHEAVRDDAHGLGYVQDVELGLCRGDWMLGIEEPATVDDDDRERAVKQREIEEHCPGGIRWKLQTKPTLKQVEMNTIATAGASHSDIVSQMHHHLLATGVYDTLTFSTSTNSDTENPPTDAWSESTFAALPSLRPTPTLAPPSSSITGVAKALAHAHHLYGPAHSTPSKQVRPPF